MPGVEADLRFPFINLEKAIGRAKQVFDADPQCRPMALQTLFEVWDYTIKSSGGHQTIGALKLYGLMDDSGVKEGRRLFLTERAKHFFLDERDNERAKVLKQFALMPRLLAALWGEWKDKPPADNIARSFLKLERRLNDQSARAVLGIYKDNLDFASLKGSDKPPEVQPELEEPTGMVETETLERPDTAGAGVNPPKTPIKVTLDGDQLTIAASLPMSELPTLLRKIAAMKAAYEAE